MSKFQVDEDTFTDVRVGIDDGKDDADIMLDYGLLRPTLNIIKKYDSYDDYLEHFSGGDDKDVAADDNDGKSDEEPERRKPQKIEPMQKGFFRGQLTRAISPQVQEADDALRISIRGLWKIIGLLEQRKMELQREIKAMERYIQQGTDIIEGSIEK